MKPKPKPPTHPPVPEDKDGFPPPGFDTSDNKWSFSTSWAEEGCEFRLDEAHRWCDVYTIITGLCFWYAKTQTKDDKLADLWAKWAEDCLKWQWDSGLRD